MKDPTDSVVQCLGWGESLVTTLVGKNPDTGTEKTLENGVECPETSSEGHVWNSLGGDIVVEDVEGDGQACNVSGDVVETGSGRALEAVCRNGISYLLDGVVWNLEFVAVAINQSSTLVLEKGLVVRAER